MTDPLLNTTTYTPNSLGETTAVTDPKMNTTNFLFNAQGQITSVTDPLTNQTQFTYDHGDLVSVIDPLGRTTRTFSDPIGRYSLITDPASDLTQIAHDNLWGVSQYTDPIGASSSILYDIDGDLTKFTDPLSHSTQFFYDSSHRLNQREDPLGNSDTVNSFNYDNDVLQTTSRQGEVNNYTYDADNRFLTATYADGSTTGSTITPATLFDQVNRFTNLTDSLGGAISRTYDGLDDMLTETTPQGTITYTYDLDGRRTSMSVPGQAEITYGYDVDSRLNCIAQGTGYSCTGTSPTPTVAITYDADSRRSAITLPNGIVGTYSYDTASELTGLTYKEGSTMVGTLTYGYDAAGRIISRGGSLYEAILPTAITSTTYNPDNQLTNLNGSSLTYDLNGSTLVSGAGTLGWDSRKRLKSVSGGSSYVYDGLNRRQSVTEGGTTTTYLYDGLNPVQEQQGGSVFANLLTGLGIDERFTRTTGGVTSTFLTDLLGSTLALTDSTGTIQTNYGYQPYGARTATGATNSNTYQFTGRERTSTMFVYDRGRYYYPGSSRFMSEDPIGLDGGLNLYAYVGGNPISWRDPTGLSGSIFCFSDDCQEEINQCETLCRRARGDSDMRHIWGGSFATCMRGCVSARCGGNPVSSSAPRLSPPPSLPIWRWLPEVPDFVPG